jgi:SAM-dependent methyltransferase
MAVAAKTRSAKFLLIRALRATGLLKIADSVKFVLGRLRVGPRNLRFRRRHPDFATPPRHLAFDALNHCDWQLYMDSGLQHARIFARVFREQLPGGAPLRVLEWGCGPGRLIRHIAALSPGREMRLAGADYNPESIAWCRANLPGIEFVENGLNPPLPFADGEFDAVYNFSVFTHLSEAVQLDWTKELARVLKPGGLLACTTAGDAYRYMLAAQSEREAYAAGRQVVQGKYREGRKWFLAISPEPFVRTRLLEGFVDVRKVKTFPEDDILQDVWSARKPAA